MPKQLMFDDNARAKLLKGVEKLAGAVAVTMGPTGRNVIIDKAYGGPTVTKDGVTVSKEVDLVDAFENMGAKLVNEVASKTSDLAGDGTTTATVLARAIFREGTRNVAAGSNPTAVRRGIEKGVAAAVQRLMEMARKVERPEEIAQVGAISANNDRAIGDLLAEALQKVGKDGVITVEEGKTTETTVRFVDGMQFDKGFVSPYFMNKPAELECQLDDALILIHEKKISNLRDLLPLLEKVAQASKPLLIIAEDVDGDALTALVVNKLRGVLNVCASKAPGFGDRRKAMLGDIATLTGGVAIVSVGAGTEAEMKQKKARVEDALHATRAAVEEGIVPGGGVALLRCREAVEKARAQAKGDEKIGVDIILHALEAPIRQIAENGGIDGAVVADEVAQKDVNIGYDANKGEYVDMLKAGIIDPVKVVRVALTNAASISGLLLTTEALVTNLDKDDAKKRKIEGSVR